MADKKKSNVSETFGKYAQPSSQGRGKKASEPKNITSDMWTPISAGQSAEAESPKKASQKKAAEKKQPQKKADQSKDKSKNSSKPSQTSLISEGKKPTEKGDKNKKKSSGNKKKSRIPKGRPISELTQEAAQTRDGKKQNQSKDVRKHQQLTKTERAYEERIKEGKSPGELTRERAEIKRKKRIKRNILSLTLFLVFVLAFVGIYTYSKGAPASVITVEGDSIYTGEEVINAAGLEIGVNMFSVREKNINSLVTKNLPYVHSVEIDRKLPDKLILTVTPTREKLLIVNSDRYICVDDSGKILSAEKKKLEEGFYRVYGFADQNGDVGAAFEPTEENLTRYELVKTLVGAMEKEGVITKGVINVKDLKNVRVLYDGRIMLYLGDCSDCESRIELAGKVIKSPEAAGKTGYIDMRFSNAAYFNEGSTSLD